jgi:hypothetical protein
MDTFFLAIGTTVCVGTASSVLFAILYTFMRSNLLQQAPRQRTIALLGWATAPLLIGLFFTTLLFSPSILNELGIQAGHCHNHAERLPHICLTNPPLDAIGGLVWPLELLLIGLLALFFRSQITAWTKQARFLRRLKATGFPVGKEYQILPWDKPLVFTVGYLSPRIFISQGLEESLNRDDLRLVLTHEQGHRMRRDSLRLSLAQALSWFHLPGTRRTLLADLHLAVEQSCDEDAAKVTGDHLRVAETIIKVERLLKQTDTDPSFGTLAFVRNNSQERIVSLLAEGRFDKPMFPVWIWAVPLLTLAILLMPCGVHSLVEYLTGI